MQVSIEMCMLLDLNKTMRAVDQILAELLLTIGSNRGKEGGRKEKNQNFHGCFSQILYGKCMDKTSLRIYNRPAKAFGL